MAVCLALTAGRLILRWRNQRKLHVDDILNAIAAILVIPFVVLCLVALPIEYQSQLYYLGRVEEPPTMAEIMLTFRVNFAMILLFWLIIYFVKGSFLIIYWRIFAISSRFRVTWWISAAFITASFLITMISIFWTCGSPSQLLNLEACEKAANVQFALLILWCSLNVLGGVLLMALPLFMVTTRMMALERSAKIGLIFIFSLVIVDITFDIVRTVYSLSAQLSNKTMLTAVWTFLEPGIAITICALPCYKSLISGNRRRNVSEATDPSLQRPKYPHGNVAPVDMELESVYSHHSREGEHPLV